MRKWVLLFLFLPSAISAQISFVNLGSSANPDIDNNADQTSYSNSSWTPPTSGLIIVYISNGQLGGGDVPTISGNSLTWVEIETLTDATSGFSLFAADASGATTGATTIDYGANTQVYCAASFFQTTGIDLSGGVVAAFVQTVTNSATATSLSITLSAATDVGNRAIAGFVHEADEVTTFRTNWTELDDLSGVLPLHALESQYRDDAFETTASASWVTSSRCGGIAAELRMLTGHKLIISN